MKAWKLTLVTICCFFLVSGSVLFSACAKDPCTELKCKNGSACTEGFCRCQTGFEGAECEFKTVNRFLGTYIGFNHCDQSTPLLDTLEVYQVAEPNVLEFYLHNNNPGDKFQGPAIGYDVNVPDLVNGIALRKVHLSVDHGNISLLVERDFDTDIPGQKSVCLFSGTKK